MSTKESAKDHAILADLLRCRPTAKRLILSLLSQPNLRNIEIKQLIKWGDLFGHDSSTIRVEAGRLTKQRILDNHQRGMYSIGKEGIFLQRTAAGWRTIQNRIGPWQGDWLCLHIAHLGRSHKPTVRMRDRAFHLMGFKKLVAGLWCRPNNFIAPLRDTYERLVELGLEPDAILLKMDKALLTPQHNPLTLWPRCVTEKQYRRVINVLTHSQNRLNQLDQTAAMRESFLVGEYAIRQINADPLLPDEMINTDLRHQMITAMKAYDRYSHPLWVQFLENNLIMGHD